MLVYAENKTEVRKITANSFWNRVGEDKEDVLRTMANAALALDDTKLNNRLRKIDSGEYVGLDDVFLQKGFNDLMDAGIFTVGELKLIFRDAELHEIPVSL